MNTLCLNEGERIPFVNRVSNLVYYDFQILPRFGMNFRQYCIKDRPYSLTYSLASIPE